MALIIGNSDGIGLAVTRLLLEDGWPVTGISRSASPSEASQYRHHILDVINDESIGVVIPAIR